MAPSDAGEIRTARARKRGLSALLILAVGLLVFGLAAGTLFVALRPVTLRVAVGPPGSDDQKLIQGFAQNFSREGSPVRLSLVSAESGPDSIAMMTNNKADLAVARGDFDLPATAESVAILRKNVVVLWTPARAASNGVKKRTTRIKSVADLAGRHVAVVGRTPANVILLRTILTESGVVPDKVKVSQFGTSDLAAMANDALIDAYMVVGPIGSKVTSDAIEATVKARGEPTFLPIDVSEAIAQRHPRYESETIPGSAFSTSPARPDDEIETVSINHLLIAPRSLSETTVAALTRQLFTSRLMVARDIPAAAKIEKPDTDKDAALPAHQGAAAYIDGNERTFLDKYGDYIWGGIILLSGLGSGVAWLRHYLTRNEKELNTQHRDKLVASISRVRAAASQDELTAMQREVDDILRETLTCFDDGAIDGDDLAAISLVLDQFHHAIADRRVALNGELIDLPRIRRA